MSFLWTVLFWIIGLTITSYTVIVILIILFFGIPATLRLERLKMLGPNRINKRYGYSILALATLFLVVSAVIIDIALESGLKGYLGGAGLALIAGLGKVGRNRDNIAEYIKINAKDLTASDARVTLAILTGE